MPNKRQMYPWDLWLHIPKGQTSGAERVLSKGKHFTVSFEHFRTRLYIAARRMGIHVESTQLPGGRLRIRPYHKTTALDRLESLSRGLDRD